MTAQQLFDEFCNSAHISGAVYTVRFCDVTAEHAYKEG